MRLLGAILAGGRSRRFGGDKALADIKGTPLFAHVRQGLAAHAEDIVVCGRSWPGLVSLADRPESGLGPLGGLCAALGFAAENGFDRVLSAPVDIYPFPGDLSVLLAGERPRVYTHQYLIGSWPSSFAAALARHLAGGERSVRSWLAASGAELVADPPGLRNINYRSDIGLD